ncbi:MAG: hypothetical protein EXX96DRAFT_579923 [Benjaminiella poitrasii]|nr:MAG: hypothetical protein EXX96DRAFT_579923 [Benjaminiella poitrasii]
MVDFFRKQSKQLNRAKKPNPLKGLIHRSNKKEETPLLHSGSGLNSPVISPTITNSPSIHNDPYMPHISQSAKPMNRSKTTSSTSLPSTINNAPHHNTAFKQRSHTIMPRHNTIDCSAVARQYHHSSKTDDLYQQHQNHSYYQQQYPISPLSPTTTVKTEIYSQSVVATTSMTTFYNQQYFTTSTTYLASQQMPVSPPLSPPPLSPTNMSFAASSNKPSWREMKRSPTYQPAASISSTDSDEDDSLEEFAAPNTNEAPLIDLLGDNLSEDDDDDLIPLGQLSISRNSDVHHLSAAEKYKEKVTARLEMNSAFV